MDSMQPLKYGQELYLYTPYNQYLFGRGFINQEVYLSQQRSSECIFLFEQKSKNNAKNHQNHDTIIYGTQLVIKHVFSGHFLSIKMVESQPQLFLSKDQDWSCYFQLVPQRNFQQNGQIVTLNSFFAIQSSHYNLKQFCISSFLRSQKSKIYRSNSPLLNPNQKQIHTLPRVSSQVHIGGKSQGTNRNNHGHHRIHSKRNHHAHTSLKHIHKNSNFYDYFLNDQSKKNKQTGNNSSSQNYDQVSDESQNDEQQQYDKYQNQMLDSRASAVRKYTGKSIQEITKKNEINIKQTTEEDLQDMQKRGDFKKIKHFQTVQNKQSQDNKQLAASHRSIKTHPEEQGIFSYLNYFGSSSQQRSYMMCRIQTNQYSFWKVELKSKQRGEYLQDNDYVQFIYSNKSDGILNINIENFPFQIKYQMTKGQEQELFSSFFKVQIENQRMYLKHILTDLYFPLNQLNQKIQLEIQPVGNQQKNQLPVFQIKFGGKVFQPLKSDLITIIPFDTYKTDAFFVNKVSKFPINQILSCQGVEQRIWIPYFKQYLNKKGKKGQKVLKQVQLLKYIAQKLLPRLKSLNNQLSLVLRQQAQKLLFKACLFNPPIKRYLIENHIQEILKERKKEFINDLIIQLLESGEGLLEKYITPEVIGNVMKQLTEGIQQQKSMYSMSYMRLFRIFCGTDAQSCVRNQNVIFSYFFPGEQSSSSQKSYDSSTITQIPDELKFSMFESNGQIIFQCNGQQRGVEYLLLQQNKTQREYLRQFLYLLADAMRNENNETIQKFKEHYQLKLLIKILTHPRQQYAFLKGPVLSLIITAYLSKTTKFKFYIFYKKYPKICYKGKLTAQNISQDYTRLLQYIKHEIHTIYYKQKLDKMHFNSTTFKHFLSLIKLSIECGFWNDENQLLDTILWLQRIFEYQQNLHINYQNYEEKLEASNLMHCKTLAVEIYTLYVDLQINMCISQLLEQSRNSLTSQIINDKIFEFYRKSCNWNLNKLIFKICSTSNSQLMKKSLFLFKKIYNIKAIVEQEFNQARKQLKQQTQSMKDKIDFITSQNNIELSINTEQDCQKFINAIFQKEPSQKFTIISMKMAINNSDNNMMDNIYRYDKPNNQFQELCFKLGIHNKIIQTLVSYLNLRKKQQNIIKKQILSNQLFLLLALIKFNLQLKQVISEYRNLFISLLSDESQLYYIACQILIQIYEQNRKLIVSDTKNLERICQEISQALKKGTYHLKNKIDMHHSTTKQKMKGHRVRKSLKGSSSIQNCLISNTLQTQQKQMSLLAMNRTQSQNNNALKGASDQNLSQMPTIFESLSRDSQFYRIALKKQSLYHTPLFKSLTIKDCKLFFFLLIFIKIQNKRVEKNQKIILKYIFNKHNLILIEQKIKAHQNDDNLIGIFKVLIYHLLECLGKNPDTFFSPPSISQRRTSRRRTSMMCIKQQTPFQDTISESLIQQQNSRNDKGGSYSIITEKSLNNLIMSIRFRNWQLKTIVYKILESRINSFKQTDLRDLLRLIQMDLSVFCEMLRKGQVYDKEQKGNLLREKISQEILKGEQNKKSHHYKHQVESFIKCCPFIIKCLQNIAIMLMSLGKQVKSQFLSLLLINVQKLFLLRNIIPANIFLNVQNLPINLQHLVNRNKQKECSLKNIDLENLFKIQIFDWSLSQLQSQKFKNVPLISDLSQNEEILYRSKAFKTKRTFSQQLLPQPFLLLLQKKISYNRNVVKFPQKTVIFPTQKQILKNFIINLIKVNSSDSNVLSDELKTFFLTYLTHSYLQTQTQQNEQSLLNLKNKRKPQTRIKLVDKQHLTDIVNGENFEKKQDLLIEYEIPLVICTILEEGFRNRYDLFCNMFELVNRLLQGGNTRGQNKFLTAFKDDHQNTIFQNISILIYDLLETIKFYYTNENLISFGVHSNQTSYEFYQSKYERKVVCSLLSDVFRFLQLLCENNNRKMKNYIFSQYDQHDKVKYLSVNFVHIAIGILHEVIQVIENNVSILDRKYQRQLLKEVKKNLLPVPNSIIDFLIQVCQIPALQNQIFLCKTDFFKVIAKIQKLSEYNSKFTALTGPVIVSDPKQTEYSLSKLFFASDKQFQVGAEGSASNENILFAYQRKLIILFRSLLQQQNQQIISIMNKKLGNKQFEYFINESLFHGGLQDIQKLKVLLLQTKLNHHLETIVDILIVKKILKIQTEFSFSGSKKQIISQLQNRIQSININFQNQNLTLYFPSHPLFDLLTERTKKFFLDKSISFKSRNQKLRDFIVSRHVIYQDIQNQKNAEDKIMNDKNMNRLYNLSIGISYLIIMLLVVFYSVTKSGTVLDVLQVQIVSGISLMQLIVTLIYAVLWGINIAPITREKLKTKQFQIGRTLTTQNKMVKTIKNSQDQGSHYLFGSDSVRKHFTRLKQDLLFVKEIYVQESASFHVVLLLLVSLFAFFIEINVYSFTLIFLFAKIQLLESILKAIRLTWKQLLIVCLLAVVFSFIFGFLTINNYIVPLYENEEIDIDINRINVHCNSITSCINSLYTQKIIGQSVNQDGDQRQFLSDLVYWGFFQILLTNIIAAIIIDKFAEQRNAKEKIQNQRHNRCYICSADKSALQRKGNDFHEHVNKTHYLWNYFYYMYSLERLKDSTEFTGIQYWIEHQIKNCKIEWIPLDQSKRDDFTEEKIDFIYSWIKRNGSVIAEEGYKKSQDKLYLRKSSSPTRMKQQKYQSMGLVKNKFDLYDSQHEFQLRQKQKKKKFKSIQEEEDQESDD